MTSTKRVGLTLCPLLSYLLPVHPDTAPPRPRLLTSSPPRVNLPGDSVTPHCDRATNLLLIVTRRVRLCVRPQVVGTTVNHLYRETRSGR